MPKNTITKLPDGLYSYSITDTTGKRRFLRSRKNETRREFARRCDDLDLKAEGEQREETFNDLFYLWLNEYVMTSLARGAYKKYESVYKNHIRQWLGRKNINDIKRKDVYIVLSKAQKKGCSKEYTKKIRQYISAPYNFAINTLGYEISSPTDKLIYKYMDDKKEKRSRVISNIDLERIKLASGGSKYENYIKVLILTGMRPSEALGLQIRDIKEGVLEIRRGVTTDGLTSLKNSFSSRDFPIFPELRKVLLDQKAKAIFLSQEGWLFPSATGKPSMNAIVKFFNRVKKQTEVWEQGGRNGLKKLKLLTPAVSYSLYDFRHTFATKQAESGMNTNVLQRLLGHSDIKTTLAYYVDITEYMMNEAIELLEKST